MGGKSAESGQTAAATASADGVGNPPAFNEIQGDADELARPDTSASSGGWAGSSLTEAGGDGSLLLPLWQRPRVLEGCGPIPEELFLPIVEHGWLDLVW
jgi:hypothetical protein